MKKHINLLAAITIMLLPTNRVMAQDSLTGKPVVIFAPLAVEDCFYKVYNPSHKAFIIHEKFTDVDSNSIESMMSSILAENSKEWEEWNALPGKEITENKTYKKFSNEAKKHTYFDLKASFKMTTNGIEIVFVKYWIVENDIPFMPALMILEKQNGRWYKSSVKMTMQGIAMTVWWYKPEILEQILNKTLEDKDVLVKTQDEKGNPDMNKIFGLLNEWKISKNEAMLAKYTDLQLRK